MDAPQDHLFPPVPVFPGDLIGPAGREDLGGDGHQVRGFIERDVLDTVIVENHLNIRGRKARQHPQPQGLHGGPIPEPPFLVTPQVGVDQGDPHDAAR